MNPSLEESQKTRLVKELMAARRAVKSAKSADDADALALARHDVDKAKVALGERGPTWWGDEPDYNRHLILKTPYADWWSEHVRKGLTP